jgi:hypothetical protein
MPLTITKLPNIFSCLIDVKFPQITLNFGCMCNVTFFIFYAAAGIATTFGLEGRSSKSGGDVFSLTHKDRPNFL